MEAKFSNVVSLIKRKLIRRAITEGAELVFNADNYAEPEKIANLWFGVAMALIRCNPVIPSIKATYNFYVGFHTGFMTCGMHNYENAINELSNQMTSGTNVSIKQFMQDCRTPIKSTNRYLHCARAMVITPYLLGKDNTLVTDVATVPCRVWEYYSMYLYTLMFHQNDRATYIEQKRLMRDHIVQKYGQVTHPETPLSDARQVAFFVDCCNHESADRRAMLAFMFQLHKMGHAITLLYPASEDVPSQDMCEHIQLPEISHEAIQEVRNSLQFDAVFYTTHMNIWSLVLASLRIGRVQCGMLGQVVTSAIPDMDYFITPKWDNPANYTETTVPLPGVGCTLTTINVDASEVLRRPNNDDVIIYCPWSVSKFTAECGDYLQQIHKACPRAVFLFHVAGHHSYQHYVAKLALFIADRVPYVVSDDESNGYFANFINCDIVVIPYPTSGFTTVLDAISMDKPVFAVADTTNYNTRCASEILRLLELGNFVAPTSAELAQKIGNFVSSGKHRTFKSSPKIASIVETHNNSLAHAFGEWVKEII